MKDKNTNEVYAMKVINSNTINLDELKHRVSIIKRLNSTSNPSIIKCVKSFEKREEQKYVVVMEYCSGGSLKDLIQKYKTESKEIPESEILKFMREILLGVNAMHNNNIIHGDLNPKNILISSKGDIRLSGFEPPRDLNELFVNSTRETTLYSSPEILTGDKRTFSSDVWSLGCILHELCCLELPYTETNKDHLINKLSKTPYDTSIIPESYSPELKTMIKKMLNFDPIKRPSCGTILAKSKHYIRIYDGNEYEGEWQKVKLSGKGILYYTDGSSYEGKHSNDMPNGKGILFYIRGDKYKGEFKNGKGTLKFADGSKYKGE